MRVLVSCVPQTGHIAPLVPLAEAFAAQGDDVLVATGADAAEPVTAHGLAFRAAGPPFDAWFRELVGRTRGTPGDGLAPDRVERYFLPRLFGEIGAARMVDDLLAVAREHRADVIVFDPLTYAGPLVAALVGARPVLHTVGPLTEPVVTELVADAVSPLWREFGRYVPADAGIYDGATVTICPPALDPAATRLRDARMLRPSPPPVDGPPPVDVPAAVWDRPVVYVTLGTFSNTNLAQFRLILDALDGLDVNAVVTAGRDVEPAALGPVGRGVHVAQFIPQATLLPHCVAAVHHAGAGTAFGILAHGLPSVALPQSADNFTIGARLATAGASRTLMPPEATVGAVRAAVADVLADPSYRKAASLLAADIAAMPAPAEVAVDLRAWVSSG